ncbi:ATP-binding protein [Oligoflexus tunisiensis]|uniref:ATP-binding protein n=1 Tax=Oligoflexus tunisiensis TaxID=708132 RepID=UPI00114CBF1C|nr:ATP-binding protein [Oligoflexus tunisiensis]
MRSLVLILLLCLPSSLTAAVIREAVQGTLDLRDWDGKDALRILGDWRFFPNELLSPEEALRRETDPDALYLQPGKPFRSVTGARLDNIGYGSYLMRVQSPCRHCRIHFALPQVYVAGKIFVFDATAESRALPLFELGRVATDAAQEKPQIGTTLTPDFEVQDQQVFHILVQVSNFHYYWGGLWQPPALYLNEEAYPSAEKMKAAFLLGIMLFCAVHAISLYLRRREDEGTRELAIFSGIMLLRSTIFVIGGWLILVSPSWAWQLVWDSIYITLAMASAWFYRFMSACFPDYASPRISRVTWPGALLLTVVFLLTTTNQSEYPVMLLYGHAILCITASLWILVQATRHKKEGSLIALVGVLALLTSGLMSLLWYLGDTRFSAMGIEIGTAIFMICQTQIVAQRSASAFHRAERLSRELVERDQTRTLFFHNTSHELRTPLHGILGFLNLISQGQYGPIGERLRLQILKITRLTEGLRDQVNTILDLAKSKRGELHLHIQRFALGDVVHRIQDISDSLQLKYPQVQFTLQNELDQNQTFLHDIEKIVAVLRNLLANAYKFSRMDAANQVKLLLKTDEEGLYLEVSDTGIGIPTEKIDRIFEEFSQIEGDARRSYEGTGLGLSIVRDLVELMKGRIEVASRPEEGSTFRIWIPEQRFTDLRPQEPLAVAPLAAVPTTPEWRETEQEAPAPIAALPNPSRFNILVVDDNELNCEVVQDLLKTEGYRVMIATGGKEGIRLIETLQPHVVLLDLMMPDVSGEDVMKYVKSQDRLRNIPILLITARANEEDKLLGLGLGADDYLAKPIVPDELRLRVRNTLMRYDDNHRLAMQEYQDRMSQLGEVVGDLAREWHGVHQAVAEDLREPEERVQKVGRLLPLPAMQRELLVKNLTQKGGGRPMHTLLEVLLPPSDEHPAARELQYLRTAISRMALSSEQARGLWRSVGQLGIDEIQQMSETIHLCESYLHLADAARHARQLMESILAFSRQEMDEHIIDLKLTIERTWHLLRMRATRLGIEMRMNLDPLTIFSVSSHIQHILLSLINNAMDAVADMPIDERWIEIAVAIDSDTRRILVQVTNGGRSLPAAVRDHLFERGFSTKGPDAKGIGLFISRRLAQQLHGDLIYQDTKGHTTFTLILPPGHQVSCAG